MSPPRNIGGFRSRYSTSPKLAAKEPGNWDGWKMKSPPSAMSLRVVNITSKGPLSGATWAILVPRETFSRRFGGICRIHGMFLADL